MLVRTGITFLADPVYTTLMMEIRKVILSFNRFGINFRTISYAADDLSEDELDAFNLWINDTFREIEDAEYVTFWQVIRI